MKMVKLENWSIICINDNGYTPPEAKRFALRGNVFGHPNHNDGKCVVTSNIKSIDSKNSIAITNSREYTLGEMEKEYKEFLISQGKSINILIKEK